MLNIAEFIQKLHTSGVQRGELVAFEASHLTPEDVQGGFADLFAGLTCLVGMDGTLVIPTCTPADEYPKPIFDPDLSPSEMGPFSDFIRHQSGVIRSHSPTHSVAAWGARAAEMVTGHRSAHSRPTPWGDGSFGLGSPWDILYEKDAWWVLVDMRPDQSPMMDYIRAVYAARHAGITRHTPFPRFNVATLGQWLQKNGACRTLAIGAHEAILFRTRLAVDVTLQALEAQIHQFEPEPEFLKWLDRVKYIRETGYLQAGAAKKVISPKIPCLRWEGRHLTGISRDLYARILVLNHHGQQLALILCDLLGISGQLVGRIRERIERLTGIPPDAVMIACTHTHSSPDTIGAGYEDPQYIEFLVEAVSDGVCQACAQLQPARLGWGRVPIRGLAHSRRKKLVDGKVFTTRYGVPSTWRIRPELIAGEGQIDPDLTVIRVESLDGQVLAAVSNFGCHASVALMSSMVSGDFPGEAMALIENALGDPVVALCTNGAAGDVDPTLEMPYWGPRNDAMARHLGTIFGAQVLECLERVEVEDRTVLCAAREPITLDVRKEWFHLLENDPDRMQQEFSRGWNLGPVVNQILRERVIHTEVQAFLLNNLTLAAFPGEIFAETGLQLKDAVQNRAVAILELSNDNIGYIPPLQAFAEGGYEVTANLWGRVQPGAAELLLEAAQRVIRKASSLS